MRIKLYILLFSSVIAAMYLSDIYFFFYGLWPSDPVATMIDAATSAGRNVDRRSRREIVEELESQNTRSAPYIGPFWFLLEHKRGNLTRAYLHLHDGEKILPLGNVANRMTVNCQESGTWSHFRSDRYGFRNPDEVWNSPQLDLALIGDSFAMGNCVDDGFDIGSNLRARYPATINLGMAGSGPDIELAILREYLPSLRPKKVLWLFYEGNDLTDLNLGFSHPILENYVQDADFSQELIKKPSEIELAFSQYAKDRAADNDKLDPSLSRRWRAFKNRLSRQNLSNNIIDVIFLRNLRHRFGVSFESHKNLEIEAHPAHTFSRFEAIITEANNKVRSWGGELIFVYIPAPNRYFASVWQKKETLSRWNYMKEKVFIFTDSLGISKIDFSEHIDERNIDRYYWYPGSHFTEYGYERLSSEILSSLK